MKSIPLPQIGKCLRLLLEKGGMIGWYSPLCLPMCSAGWLLLGVTGLPVRLQQSQLQEALNQIPQAFLHRWKEAARGLIQTLQWHAPGVAPKPLHCVGRSLLQQ